MSSFLHCKIRNQCLAITGANGKSTVTSLTAHMLQCSGLRAVAAGNIGLPILDALQSDAEVFVLELSSFQLDTTHSVTKQSRLYFKCD